MNVSRRSVLTASLAAAAALGLAACGGNDAAKTEPGAEGTTAATLMLNWYPYGEHAALYYGVEKGIFKKHGIDLTIKAGQGSTKTVQAAGQDQVDFGWADTPALLANIDKGVKVKSIGVFLQTTPSAVQVFTESGIKVPADLKGKTIAVSAGDAPTTTFPIFLKAAGLEEGDVKQQNLDAAGKMAALLSNKVDGLIGFAHDQGPTIAAKSGKEMTYLRYSDAGVNFYSNGLVASDGFWRRTRTWPQPWSRRSPNPSKRQSRTPKMLPSRWTARIRRSPPRKSSSNSGTKPSSCSRPRTPRAKSRASMRMRTGMPPSRPWPTPDCLNPRGRPASTSTQHSHLSRDLT